MTHDNMPAPSDDARTAVLELLDRRSDRVTICPSEVARAIASKAGADPTEQDWRAVMPVVRAAIDQMVDDGLIELNWKGKSMPSRSGLDRIGRAHRED
ncbi:DUF3253 domain-containing protein [Sphingobium sp. YR768]|uniref:DUF3253 domain-containing protein n=1 Tax=Sphingobium sp. YR768 TaxID=1884365 RepID=UPI0008B12803|nr:DUF3253 domain-containing protein [Sphingobium sp. YR768]SER57053.1 Protein of unknown function [Sphingobium sp. YR768]